MSIRAHLLLEVWSFTGRSSLHHRAAIPEFSWSTTRPFTTYYKSRVFRQYFSLPLFFYAPAAANKPLWLVAGRSVAESARNTVNKVSSREMYVFFSSRTLPIPLSSLLYESFFMELENSALFKINPFQAIFTVLLTWYINSRTARL